MGRVLIIDDDFVQTAASGALGLAPAFECVENRPARARNRPGSLRPAAPHRRHKILGMAIRQGDHVALAIVVVSMSLEKQPGLERPRTLLPTGKAIAPMPTVTVSLKLLADLGLALTDGHELKRAEKRALEALLVSRGFRIPEPIHVRQLANDDGFLLTQ